MDIEAVTAFLATDAGKALVESHEATVGLRTKKDELLSVNSSLKTQLDAYKALGLDVTAIAELVKSTKKTEPDKVAVDPAKDAELQHLKTQLDTERNTRTARENAWLQSFVSTEVISAIGAAKGEPALLKPIITSRVKGELKEDGTIALTVINTDGTPMFKNGKAATLADLLEDIKADKVYGRAFEPTEAHGSGTRTGKVQPTTSGKTLTEIMAMQKKTGI